MPKKSTVEIIDGKRYNVHEYVKNSKKNGPTVYKIKVPYEIKENPKQRGPKKGAQPIENSKKYLKDEIVALKTQLENIRKAVV